MSFCLHVVWFDVVEDSEIVPSFEDSIFVKATRLPASSAGALKKLATSKTKVPVSKSPAGSSSAKTSPAPVPPRVSTPGSNNTSSPHAAFPQSAKSTSPTEVEDFFGGIVVL